MMSRSGWASSSRKCIATGRYGALAQQTHPPPTSRTETPSGAFALDHGPVDGDVAVLVDEHGPPRPGGLVLEQVDDRGRLADAEEAGDEVGGDHCVILAWSGKSRMQPTRLLPLAFWNDRLPMNEPPMSLRRDPGLPAGHQSRRCGRSSRSRTARPLCRHPRRVGFRTPRLASCRAGSARLPDGAARSPCRRGRGPGRLPRPGSQGPHDLGPRARWWGGSIAWPGASRCGWRRIALAAP